MSLEFISVGDFLDGLPSEMPWVIPPLAATGSSIMLYGRQKVGKSSAVLQLMHSLITGEPWLGFPVERTGRVIYLQADMPAAETKRMIDRAAASGLELRDGLYVPRLEKGEHKVPFNILNPRDQEALAGQCARLSPIAVVVDTINDTFVPPPGSTDVGALARQVHTAFKHALGDAVFVYLNHKRKQALNFKGEELDDEDGFLGSGAWAQVASSILELKRDRKTREIALVLRDLRLDTYPGTSLALKKNEHGFFVRPMTSQQMLLFWPDCLPSEEAERLRAAVRTKSDVFRDIAERTQTPLETVRQQFYRHRGADFAWAALLEGEEPEKKSA